MVHLYHRISWQNNDLYVLIRKIFAYLAVTTFLLVRYSGYVLNQKKCKENKLKNWNWNRRYIIYIYRKDCFLSHFSVYLHLLLYIKEILLYLLVLVSLSPLYPFHLFSSITQLHSWKLCKMKDLFFKTKYYSFYRIITFGFLNDSVYIILERCI